MLQYEKMDVSQGIDVNKTSASKEYEICPYWLIKNVGFKFEEHVCNKLPWFINDGLFFKKYSNIERNKSYVLMFIDGY